MPLLHMWPVLDAVSLYDRGVSGIIGFEFSCHFQLYTFWVKTPSLDGFNPHQVVQKMSIPRAREKLSRV